MKVKAIEDCTGVGYEDFSKGETRNLKKTIAEKLINFGYAEEIKTKTKKSTTKKTKK